MKNATLTALFLGAALGARPAAGQQAELVRRGELFVHVTGTVVPADVFRLKSTIDGRAERILASTGVWVLPDRDLGLLLNREFAALTDAHGSTEVDVLAERWKPVYQPRRIRCPDQCYVLKSFTRSREWVKPRAVLFEAAAHLRMVGRVRPEEAPLVSNGMTLYYWSVRDPAQHFRTVVARYAPDEAQPDVRPGGTFLQDAAFGPEHFFPPGTEWEGDVVIADNVLLASTHALLRFGGDVFLPVRVSTGITTLGDTELLAGVEERHRLLNLEDSQLRGVLRHQVVYDSATLRLMREPSPPPAEKAGPAAAAPVAAPPVASRASGPERFVVKEVVFSGNHAVSRFTLRRLIALRAKDALDEAQLRDDRDKILAKYHARGFFEADARYAVLRDTGTQQAEVRWFITEGPYSRRGGPEEIREPDANWREDPYAE